MKIHLFGASSLTGISFLEICNSLDKDFDIIKYSRNNKTFKFLDFSDIDHCKNFKISESSIFVSFAPIWLFSEFLSNLNKFSPDKFKLIRMIILCSSSSVVTKKYSINKFDQQLVKNLSKSEDNINDLSIENNISLVVLRPSMIYGKLDKKRDKNISKILFCLRSFPFILIPSETGLRQPIHTNQLANVVINFIDNYFEISNNKVGSKFILLGGDSQITYEQLIKLLKNSLNKNDRGRKCKIITIPNKIFYTLLIPVFWISPKSYEALLRMSANLSGFTLVSKILKTKNTEFPIKPYA